MVDEAQLMYTMGNFLTAKNFSYKSTSLHYVVGGSGPPLLLLHGATMGWGQWYPTIPSLCKNFTCYAVDLPGSGSSTPVNFSHINIQNDFVLPLSAFIKSLEQKTLFILGHSIGAFIGIHLARNIPNVQRLILVSPMGFSDYVPIKFRLIEFAIIRSLLLSTKLQADEAHMRIFLEDVMVQHAPLKREFVHAFTQSIRKNPLSHPIRFMAGFIRGGKIIPQVMIHDEISSLRTKSLVLLGQNDPLIPSSRVIEGIRQMANTQAYVYKNTGHVPHIERKNDFNTRIKTFLC